MIEHVKNFLYGFYLLVRGILFCVGGLMVFFGIIMMCCHLIASAMGTTTGQALDLMARWTAILCLVVSLVAGSYALGQEYRKKA